MDRKLRTVIDNCIKIIPYSGSKFALKEDLRKCGICSTGYVCARELPAAEEMVECIEAKAKRCNKPCIVLVCRGGEMDIYGDDSHTPFLFNVEYVGKKREIRSTKDDAFLTRMGDCDCEFDIVVSYSDECWDLWDYPEREALIEAHKKAYERGESKVKPEYIEFDEPIEVFEYHYYRYKKGGKMATSL